MLRHSGPSGVMNSQSWVNWLCKFKALAWTKTCGHAKFALLLLLITST